MERRVPLLTPTTAGAAALAGLGLLFGFIGLIVTSSGSNKITGATLSSFGLVLTVLAVALVAVDTGGRRVDPRQWRPALFIGAGLAGAALLFSLIGAVKAAGDGFDSFDGYWSWLPFGTNFAFLCIGWLLLMRPAPQMLARIFVGATAGMAAIFALVGLATGIGAGISFYGVPHGAEWFAWAVVWGVLAIAGGLSQRSP